MTWSWLPSIAYPPANSKGDYWGPVTATLNWCEEDYYATPYAAEIVNTLTNLLFIYLGIRGLRSCLKHGHDFVFVVLFSGHCLVGVGSFLFHSTLKYPMQLVDELSMIYTACLMAFATFSYGRSKASQQGLGFGLIALAIFITLYYHYLQEPVFHQVAFGILTLSIVVHSIYVMENKIRPYLQQKYSRSKAHLSSTKPLDNPVTPERDQEFMSAMWAMVCKGLSIFLLGWMLWALDTAYCSTLRHWRRQMGLPWGIVLEGHGWWHIFTGAGSYYYITWGIWLRRCLNHQEEEYTLEWEGILTSLPEVVPVSSIPEKGHLSNGGHNDKITRNKVADLKLS